jgi:hypothetical protein
VKSERYVFFGKDEQVLSALVQALLPIWVSDQFLVRDVPEPIFNVRDIPNLRTLLTDGGLSFAFNPTLKRYVIYSQNTEFCLRTISNQCFEFKHSNEIVIEDEHALVRGASTVGTVACFMKNDNGDHALLTA